MTQPTAQSVLRNRAAVAEELRRLLPKMEGFRTARSIPFGLAAIDRHLPRGGLSCGALHEVVPEAGATPAAFGFLVALLGRISSPPPAYSPPSCGEGSGVGVGRFYFAKTSALSTGAPNLPTPHPTLPHKGGGKGSLSPVPASSPRPPDLRPARLWPAAWSWAQRAGAFPASADPGGDGAPQGHAVGDGGSAAFARGRSGRWLYRPDRSENQSTAATRRHRLRIAALSAAAGRVSGSERGGDALARRSGARRARPLRPDHAGALAALARTLPQRTHWGMDGGVRSCRASFQSGCRAGRSCDFSQHKRNRRARTIPPPRQLIRTSRSCLPLPDRADRASPR